MNTTDYFTYVNAMFLFCIFTCGLLVWAVIRGYILKGKLLKEQDSHLKATNTNTLLNKALSAKNAALQVSEHKTREAEKKIRELQGKLTESEKQANGYKSEFIARPKRVKKVKSAFDELSDHAKEASAALDNFSELFSTTTLPKLVHGLTVKNPTEAEAKMIFDEARRLGVPILDDSEGISDSFPWIWYANGELMECIDEETGIESFVTAKEFVQRMQNGRG